MNLENCGNLKIPLRRLRDSALRTRKRPVQGIMFGKVVLVRGEVSATDLVLNLPLDLVVAVKVGHWGVTAGTSAILRDTAFLMSRNRLDFLICW